MSITRDDLTELNRRITQDVLGRLSDDGVLLEIDARVYATVFAGVAHGMSRPAGSRELKPEWPEILINWGLSRPAGSRELKQVFRATHRPLVCRDPQGRVS